MFRVIQSKTVKFRSRFPTSFVLIGAILAMFLVPEGTGKAAIITSAVYSRVELDRYVEKWKHADGLDALVISDFFVAFLISNPGLFFDVMAQEEGVYEAWTMRLESLSFEERGDCVDRGCLRRAALESLSTMPRSHGEKADALRRELMFLLEGGSSPADPAKSENGACD